MRINSPFETLKRFTQGVVGLILGWLAAHHFVDVGEGVWPDLSIIGYFFKVWEIPGGAAVLMFLLSLFSRRLKRKTERPK